MLCFNCVLCRLSLICRLNLQKDASSCYKISDAGQGQTENFVSRAIEKNGENGYNCIRKYLPFLGRKEVDIMICETHNLTDRQKERKKE